LSLFSYTLQSQCHNLIIRTVLSASLAWRIIVFPVVLLHKLQVGFLTVNSSFGTTTMSYVIQKLVKELTLSGYYYYRVGKKWQLGVQIILFDFWCTNTHRVHAQMYNVFVILTFLGWLIRLKTWNFSLGTCQEQIEEYWVRGRTIHCRIRFLYILPDCEVQEIVSLLEDVYNVFSYTFISIWL
jgi:hypothetical protein